MRSSATPMFSTRVTDTLQWPATSAGARPVHTTHASRVSAPWSRTAPLPSPLSSSAEPPPRSCIFTASWIFEKYWRSTTGHWIHLVIGALSPALRVQVGARTHFTLYYSTLQPSTDAVYFWSGSWRHSPMADTIGLFSSSLYYYHDFLSGADALGTGPAGEHLQYTMFN